MSLGKTEAVFLRLRLSLLGLGFSALAACGGGTGGGGAAPIPTPTQVPKLSVNPGSVAMTSVGATVTVTLSETGYAGSFTVNNSNTAVVSVQQKDASEYVLTAASAGTSTITFSDASSNTAKVSVGVTTSGVTIGAHSAKGSQ